MQIACKFCSNLDLLPKHPDITQPRDYEAFIIFSVSSSEYQLKKASKWVGEFVLKYIDDIKLEVQISYLVCL